MIGAVEALAGGEMEVGEAEVEKGEEGGGTGLGVVVDTEVGESTPDHGFKMKMEISQWMMQNGAAKAA